MLKDSFYIITNLQGTEGSLTATLQLNPAHAIFKGHFPGQPVVPGVCLMQMVKEVLEVQLTQSLLLNKADYLKFISPIIPEPGKLLQLQVKYSRIGNDSIKASATLVIDTVSSFKFQGYYKVSSPFLPA